MTAAPYGSDNDTDGGSLDVVQLYPRAATPAHRRWPQR